MSENIRFAVTREKLEEARKRLASDGLDLQGDSGYTEHKKFGVQYDFKDGVLTLELKKKPMLIRVSWVRDALIRQLAAEGVFEIKT